MTPDHPNAQFLAHLYGGIQSVKNDSSLSASERAERLAALQRELFERLPDDWVIHTGGVQLAATGGGDLASSMARRRAELSEGSFRSDSIDWIVADDHYAVLRGDFVVERNGQLERLAAMGVWRFEDGVPTEHWEIGPGPAWDDYFLGADPSFEGGSALDFWFRPSEPPTAG